MIQLSRAQTLGLERLFKKKEIDIELLGIAAGEYPGDVVIRLTRTRGQVIEFTLMANGRVRKDETDDIQRQHIAG